MKSSKRITSVALSFVLALSLMAAPVTQSEAAAKVTISKKKVTLYVGKTAKLKLKNVKKVKAKKAKWTSTNKKVATVKFVKKNVTAIVTAKKAGTAKIKAKLGKKTYTCKVTVKKPQSLTMLRDTFATWVGDAVGVTPIALDNEPVDVSALKYSSSNPAVAKPVGSTGGVAGIAEGTATITIKTPDNKKLTAKVIVYKSRTDAEPVNDIYEYERARKIEELAKAGITVKEGEDFAGYWVIEKNVQKSLEKYAADIYTKVQANNGKSIFDNNTSKDAVASMISVYNEEENAQSEHLKKGLADYLKDVNAAKSNEELMLLNAKIIASGDTGIWKNRIDQDYNKDESTAGVAFKMNPTLPIPFELGKKSEYDGNDGKVNALKALIDGVLEACGETAEERTANVDKVLKTLKEFAPEKSAQEIYPGGEWTPEIAEEYEKNGFGGASLSVDEVDKKWPSLKFKESLDGTGYTGSVQIAPFRVFDTAEKLAKSADTETLRELIKVCVGYQFFAETKKGYVLNYKLTQEKTGATQKKTDAEIETMYPELLAARLANEYGWEACTAYTDEVIGEQAKNDIIAMFDRVREQYKTCFKNAEWMSESTKAAALKKIEKLNYAVFKPTDLSQFVIDQDLDTAAEGGNIVTNIHKFNTGYWKARAAWTKDVAYGEEAYWKQNATTFSPFSANGSYVPGANCIGVFVGLIDKESYDPNDILYSYGRVGYAIAHEFGHGFDSNGTLYDETGAKNPWISAEDNEKWEAKKSKFAKYYENFSVYYYPDSEKILYSAGTHELAEIMTDQSAYEIVTRIIKTDYPGAENLKKVYENMAGFWTQESFDPSLVGRDTHPYGKLRGSVPLMMLDEFYDVFGVGEGDAMYIAPEDRTRIWS